MLNDENGHGNDDGNRDGNHDGNYGDDGDHKASSPEHNGIYPGYS